MCYADIKVDLNNFIKAMILFILLFLQKNILYNVIVTDKNNEQGVLKLLKINSPIIPEADKFIILFEDDSCFDNIKTPYAYCVYPELKVINRKNA